MNWQKNEPVNFKIDQQILCKPKNKDKNNGKRFTQLQRNEGYNYEYQHKHIVNPEEDRGKEQMITTVTKFEEITVSISPHLMNPEYRRTRQPKCKEIHTQPHRSKNAESQLQGENL